ncbi:MAG: prepilin-type N-terminal cleavage/methylation domain-containing protein [Planctomycetes bacterium]|nr:prepilin-type N-terminal cleavage/methylation domain-containing protein [Planctomycetota bacterium]
MRRHHRTTGGRGFTLAEVLIASAMLAFVASAVMVPYAAGIQNDRFCGIHTEAVALGQDLMEDILALPFYDPETPDTLALGPDAGEFTRATFDNIDDYHGYSEAEGVVTLALTDIEPDDVTEGLWREVTVTYLRLPGQPEPGPEDKPFSACHVTVTVYCNAEMMTSMERLIYANP